jgi:hypothetical protein
VTLSLTPDTLRLAYDYLNGTKPFSRWNLPDGEDVKFRVVGDHGRWGWYQRIGQHHVIGVSRKFIGSTDSLMRLMAHEMIHLHEEHAGACGSGQHSAAFNRWAAEVCKVHGFDPLLF